MDNVREYKRGEIIFKEGENIDNIFILQSGRVSLFIERNGKKIEIEQVSGSQVLGENALFDKSKALYSAEAVANVKVLFVPVSFMKTMLETTSPGVKLVLNGLYEGAKNSRVELKSMKMETDSSPMPQMYVPKLFSIYVLLARHLGKKQDSGDFKISWEILKRYSVRVFQEVPQRLLSGLELLSKLNYVELSYQKNDEGEEELSDVFFKDIQFVEDFAEFYQFHLYKPGKSEPMFVDKIALKICKVLVEMAEGMEKGHKGMVSLDYNELISNMKSKVAIDIKNTHWDLLEKKGLLVQRKSLDDKIILNIDKDEFCSTYSFWRVLDEIDKWNEHGFVDLNEKEEDLSAAGELKCPGCEGGIETDQKFCHHCGFKLAA